MPQFDDDHNPSDGAKDEFMPTPVTVELEKERLLFQSVHRRHLSHIVEDEVLSARHDVPGENLSAKRAYSSVIQGLLKESFRPRAAREWIGTFLPCYNWLCTYDWRTMLLSDILAGLAVGVMVVPQSMSYAKLAELPVEYGLYSALFPVWAYSLFGSSRQLAVGPVALVSLLMATGLDNQMSHMGISVDDPNYLSVRTTLAIQISLLVGVFNIVMGILRLGFVTIFLSHAVISGFISGATVIIAMAQLKNILGVNANGDTVQTILASIIKDIGNFNYNSFLMGTSSIAALLLFKQASKKYPKQKWLRAIGPLFVTTVTILVTWGFNLSKVLPIVKSIPSGFPSFTVGLWSPFADFGRIATTAISITIIGFMESIAIAKSLAAKHKYELDSSTELIGLGVANFVGSMFQAYPVTGSFSRSAVNDQSGAQSGISGVVSATLVGLTLLFLTRVFEYMPLSVLGAIVIAGVINLFDYPEAIFLWKVHRRDFAVWTTAFLGTTLLGVETGLAISVIVSLILIIYESAFPHTAVLGRLPGSTVYRNIKMYPLAERYDGIVIVRIDAPIYFANTDNIRTKLNKYEKTAQAEMAESSDSIVKFVLIELSPVSHIDSTGLHTLQDLIESYKARGVQLLLSNPSEAVMQSLVRSKLADAVGREHIFVSTHDAVKWSLDQMDSLYFALNGETRDFGEKRSDCDEIIEA